MHPARFSVAIAVEAIKLRRSLATFFAVVASSAEIGIVLPWQIPIKQFERD